MSASEKPAKINVDASSDTWLLCLVLLATACYGDPDLLDVLRKFCRRYMEATGHG